MAATSTALDFTATSAFSIAGVFGALVFAYVGLTKLLPKTASRTDKITFLWLVSDSNTLAQRIQPLTRFLLRHSTR